MYILQTCVTMSTLLSLERSVVLLINYRGGDAGERGHTCLHLATPSTPTCKSSRTRPPRTPPGHAPPRSHTRPHAQTRLPGGRRREAGITSLRPPLCNNQGRYHQRGRGRGTSAASLWRRRGRWTRIPSSLSSFSVFGLQDPLVTVESGAKWQG